MNPFSLVYCSAGPGPEVGAPTAKLRGSKRVNDRPYIGRPIMSLSFGTPFFAQKSPAACYRRIAIHSMTMKTCKFSIYIIKSMNYKKCKC